MEKAKSMSAQLIEVIEVKTSAGKGTVSDPVRIITEFWSKEGALLAVNDPHFNPYEHRSSLGHLKNTTSKHGCVVSWLR